MKTIFLILASVGIVSIMTGVALAQEINSGFGGIDWAPPLEAVKGCEKVAERGDILYCVRRNQVHTLLGESHLQTRGWTNN